MKCRLLTPITQFIKIDANLLLRLSQKALEDFPLLKKCKSFDISCVTRVGDGWAYLIKIETGKQIISEVAYSEL